MAAHFTNRPCAAHGLKSFRYRGPWGFIMIGAASIRGALSEAARSLSQGKPTRDRLEQWDGEKYVPIRKR